MAIYRGSGGAGDATNDVTINRVTELQQETEQNAIDASASATAAASSASSASTSATQAATSATNAATSATNAATSETNAATSATSASTSATSATASATAASTSETNAATSATNAATSETNAASSASAASTSETNAASSASSASTSATNAATSATSASASATSATASETNAAASETAAASSATSAANSATAASASETNAGSSATAAATSATNAAASETASAASASSANTSATSASNSASTASTAASTATTAATNAAASETAAASSATSASNSASTAATSATQAAQSAASAATLLDNFDDRYLGAKASDPSVDNDGDPLVVGALYFNSTDGVMKTYTASGWLAASSASVATMAKFKFTATSGQTVFTGTDDGGDTLSMTVGSEIVTLNGVVLEAGTDYTPASGSVTLATGASTGDELNVFAFGNFQVADTVSKSLGGTFDAGVNVLGNVGIGTSSPERPLHIASATPYIVFDETDTSQKFSMGTGGGKFFLYDETDSAQRLTVDSSGNVGIGTDSPARELTVKGGLLGFRNDTTGYSNSDGFDIGMAGFNAYIAQRENANIIIETNGSERMRIDSSGNLLVGKTSSDNGATAGFEAQSDGDVAIAKSGRPLIVNRIGSDGGIVQFRKDGSTVGSIGTLGSVVSQFQSNRDYVTLGAKNTGIVIQNVSNKNIRPYDPTTGTSVDNQVDLGIAVGRFKNLYLSGGVYLGGTGSANKLDDYEEGTFTPAINSSNNNASITHTTQIGRYTKVGNIVHVGIRVGINYKAGGTGFFVVKNLPFTSKTVSGMDWAGAIGYTNVFNSGATPDGVLMPSNNTQVYFYRSPTHGADLATTSVIGDCDGNGNIYFTLTYETD